MGFDEDCVSWEEVCGVLEENNWVFPARGVGIVPWV